MERELFSRGAHGQVYRISAGEKVFFPHADLRKEEKTYSPYSWLVEYYMNKISSTLYPDNFIDMHAVIKKNEFDPNSLRGLEHHIFSTLATTPSEHATFSQHTRIPFNSLRKRSSCTCGECKEHRMFHKDNSLKSRAKKLAGVMRKSGIHAPFDDASDYCIDDKNNLIFFEVDWVDPVILQQSLNEHRSLNPQQQYAERLLKRYIHWADKAKEYAESRRIKGWG